MEKWTQEDEDLLLKLQNKQNRFKVQSILLNLLNSRFTEVYSYELNTYSEHTFTEHTFIIRDYSQ